MSTSGAPSQLLIVRAFCLLILLHVDIVLLVLEILHLYLFFLLDQLKLLLLLSPVLLHTFYGLLFYLGQLPYLAFLLFFLWGIQALIHHA